MNIKIQCPSCKAMSEVPLAALYNVTSCPTCSTCFNPGQALAQAASERENKIEMALKLEGAIGNTDERIAVLCKILGEEQGERAMRAVAALGEIGGPEAVNALCDALTYYDESTDFIICVNMNLAKIGAPAVEKLCLLLNHDYFDARCNAAIVLGKIRDARALGPLRARLRRIDNPIRRFLSWAFCEWINVGFGVRKTPWQEETDRLRKAIKEIEENLKNN